MSYSSEKLKLNNSKMFNVFKYLVLIFAFLFVGVFSSGEKVEGVDGVTETEDLETIKFEFKSNLWGYGSVNVAICTYETLKNCQVYMTHSNVPHNSFMIQLIDGESSVFKNTGSHSGNFATASHSLYGFIENFIKKNDVNKSIYEAWLSEGFRVWITCDKGINVWGKTEPIVITHDTRRFSPLKVEITGYEAQVPAKVQAPVVTATGYNDVNKIYYGWAAADKCDASGVTYGWSLNGSSAKYKCSREADSAYVALNETVASGSKVSEKKDDKGFYKLFVIAIDKMGNATLKVSDKIYVDNVAPAVSVEIKTGVGWKKQHTVNIKHTDDFSKMSVYYCWSTASSRTAAEIKDASNSADDCGKNENLYATYSTTVTSPTSFTNEKLYLHVYVVDKAGNGSNVVTSGSMKVDNTLPTIKIDYDNKFSSWSKSVKVSNDLSDSHSGIKSIEYNWQDENTIECGVDECSNDVFYEEGKYYVSVPSQTEKEKFLCFRVIDNVDNKIEDCKKLYIDNVDPELSFKVDDTAAKNNHSFDIVISDNNKGGASNNKYYLKKSDGTKTNEFTFIANDVDYKEKIYSVDTSKVSTLNGKLNGSYRVCAYVKDLAGNITDSCYDTPMHFDNTKIELVENEISVKILDSKGNEHLGADENGNKAFNSKYKAEITVPLTDYSLYYGDLRKFSGEEIAVSVNITKSDGTQLDSSDINGLNVSSKLDLSSCTYKETYNDDNMCNLVVTVTYLSTANEDAEITLSIDPTSVKDQADNGINIERSKVLCTLVLDNTPNDVTITRVDEDGNPVQNKYVYVEGEKMYVKVTFDEKQIWELGASSGVYPKLTIGGYEFTAGDLSEDGKSIIYYITIQKSDVISANTTAVLSYNGISGKKLVDKGGNVADYAKVNYNDIKEIRINSGLPEIEEMKWNIYHDSNYSEKFENHYDGGVHYNSEGYYVEIEVKYSVYKGLAATEYLKLENLMLGNASASSKGCNMSSHDSSTKTIKIRCGNKVELDETTIVTVNGGFIKDQSGVVNTSTNSIMVVTNNTQEELFNSNPKELRAELYNKFIALDGVVKVTKAQEHLNGIYDAYGGKIDSYCSLFGERDCEEESLSVTVSKENSETIDIVVYNKYGVQYLVNASKRAKAKTEDFEIMKINDVGIEVTVEEEKISYNTEENKYVYYYEKGDTPKVSIEPIHDVYSDGEKIKELCIKEDDVEQTLLFRSGKEIKVTVDFVEYDSNDIEISYSSGSSGCSVVNGIVTCEYDGFDTVAQAKTIIFNVKDNNNGNFGGYDAVGEEKVVVNNGVFKITLTYDASKTQVEMKIEKGNLFYKHEEVYNVDYSGLFYTPTGNTNNPSGATISIKIKNTQKVYVPVEIVEDGVVNYNNITTCSVSNKTISCQINAKVNVENGKAKFIILGGDGTQYNGSVTNSGTNYEATIIDKENGYTYKFTYSGGESAPPEQVAITGPYSDEACVNKVTGVVKGTPYYYKITFVDDNKGATLDADKINFNVNVSEKVVVNPNDKPKEINEDGQTKFKYTFILSVVFG